MSNFGWQHTELRLKVLKGEVIQLPIELLKKLSVSVEAVELSTLDFESSERGLLRAVTSRN